MPAAPPAITAKIPEKKVIPLKVHPDTKDRRSDAPHREEAVIQEVTEAQDQLPTDHLQEDLQGAPHLLHLHPVHIRKNN